jgi:hypothetical protein
MTHDGLVSKLVSSGDFFKNNLITATNINIGKCACVMNISRKIIYAQLELQVTYYGITHFECFTVVNRYLVNRYEIPVLQYTTDMFLLS